MNSKIKCIARYIELNGYSGMKEYLIATKLAEPVEANSLTRTLEQAEFVYYSLRDGAVSEKLLLLSFEWKILPLEQIKITCISTRDEQFFTHGY